MSPPPPLEDPPPRQAWEEPPADGWRSSLEGMLRSFGRFVVTLAAAWGAWHCGLSATRLHRHAATSWGHAGAIALWCAFAVLCLAFVYNVVVSRGFLSLTAAILTDKGRLARLRGRPPIWLDAAPGDGALRIAHLSDLHVAEGERVRLVEKDAPAGNARLGEILDAAAREQPDLILVTGDVTDRGTLGAWMRFLEAIESRGLEDKVVIVPGNHDIALIDEIDTVTLRRGRRRWARRALRTDRFGVVQLANLLKFADAFARTGGGKRGFVAAMHDLPLGEGPTVPYLDAWRAVTAAVRPLVEQLPTLPVPRRSLRYPLRQWAAIRAYEGRIARARDLLQSLFPVAVPLPEQSGVLFVLNSSSSVARHAAANAIGWLGRGQLRRLERLARHFRQPLRLVAVHHHLVRRGEEVSADLVPRLMARFAVLGDAARLVAFCRRHHIRAVLNGHRHLSYQLRLPGGCALLAAPSSTLGDELAGDPRPQLERYEVAPSGDARSIGMFRAVVRLPGTELLAAPATAKAALGD